MKEYPNNWLLAHCESIMLGGYEEEYKVLLEVCLSRI